MVRYSNKYEKKRPYPNNQGFLMTIRKIVIQLKDPFVKLVTLLLISPAVVIILVHLFGAKKQVDILDQTVQEYVRTASGLMPGYMSSLFLEESYVATITERTFERPRELVEATMVTPNFYEILLKEDCLPVQPKCNKCIRNPEGSTCEVCAEVCPCYCEKLCDVVPEKKFVSKYLYVSLPPKKKDPDRLVPRIVHQTWFEPVTEEKYPNMSRLIESWKQSGWEYRFYDDTSAPEFLSTHYPPEVREAYDALIPGAFKADLFRYCVLFITGGVYVDMDVMLETNLDSAVTPEVGFMTPMDSPPTANNLNMCLWNGFIASAPGHPFLSRVIEMVVNNVRNRFTSVDIENLMCPNQELSISHKSAILFTAGPCILGAAMNFVMRRHLQTSFEPGEIDIWDQKDANNVNPLVLEADDMRDKIPGKSIILEQNKEDMGAHRFTRMDKNLIVAATDMPDYDDRETLEDADEREHYSKTRVTIGVYGLENLYEDSYMVNEEIRIIIDEDPTKYDV